MATDAMLLFTLANELNTTLSGGRIERIGMPDKDNVVLYVKPRGTKKPLSLLLCADPSAPRLHITDEAFENPLAAHAFLMHLRKHIGGGVISSVSAVPRERVAHIKIEACDELGYKHGFSLFVETLGRFSNIILVDENGLVTDAAKRVSVDTFAARVVLTGVKYALPPSQPDKISPDDKDGLLRVLSNFHNGKLHEYLMSNIYGYAPASVKQAIFDAYGCVSPSAEVVTNAPELLLSSLAALDEAYSPCCSVSDGRPTDFFVKPYTHTGGEFSSYPSLSAAMDAVYSARRENGYIAGKAAALSAAVKTAAKKNARTLSLLKERILQSRDYERDRIFGELITANIYRIKRGEATVALDDYYTGKVVEISLDTTLSPQQNAQRYYRAYAKKKTAIERSEEQAALCEERADYYESVLAMLEKANGEGEIGEIEAELVSQGVLKKSKTKRKPKPSSPLSLTVDGYKVLIGKNNLQNDALVRSSDGGWLWLHAQKIHGSHGVIQGVDIPQDTINRVAAFVAHFSKASMSANVPVDYTLIKFVKKPSGAAPGKVIYTHQQTVNVTPVKP